MVNSPFFKAVIFMEQLLYGESDKGIGIACLWTRKELIATRVKESNYTVIGQLYSCHQGINSLIVNCLANKTLRYLIVTGLDLSGSGETLAKLFQNGVNENRRVNGDDNFILDPNIPFAELESFRQNVELIDLRGTANLEELNLVIEKLEKKAPYGENQCFELSAPPAPEVFPSQLTGLQVVAPNIPKAWPQILDKIMTFGALKKSEYEEPQKELLCFTSIITDDEPLPSNGRGSWNRFFPFTREDVAAYVPQVCTVLKIDGVEYTYGQRLRSPIDQIAHITEKIKTSPHSRRHVACTWTTKRDYNNPNAPCLVLLQFNITDGKLFLTAFIRSNDMYAAWPKNAFALRELQRIVANNTDLRMGFLSIVSQSCHIYQHDFTKVKEVIAAKQKIEWQPDPNGNLVITTRNGKIVVIHIAQGSRVLEEFHGKTAIEVYRYIASRNKISVISHALDIGCELQKAEIALKLGIQYTQDKPLFFHQ